jgi:hypothetical protein
MLRIATALQTTSLVHPRVQSLTHTHMKTINPTEEMVIATILLISGAIPADDLDDDYSREVPTAEERSPSLRRGQR